MSATTAERMRRHTGPALFSFGFRPFFLFAALWSALSVPIWVGAFVAGDGTVGGLDGRAWHIHEMLFGYLAGVVAGFLLTAVPNWTGRLPVTGWRLAALFGLWAAGRAASLLPEALAAPAAVVDCAFLIVFAGVIWREVLAAGNRRNLPVCLMVSALAVTNVLLHLGAVLPEAVAYAERGAVAVVCGLIALIGGRIVPSFTHNWTAARGLKPDPQPFGGFDKAVLAVTGPALVAWVIWPDHPTSGALLLLAGVANLARLARWRGWVTGPEPIVWILHLGYLWLGLGLLLLGAAKLLPDFVPASAGLHGLAAGAMGVMTLAVMTRATLGHTGRSRHADGWTLGLYVMANLAALTRVVAPFLGDFMPALLIAAAALWAGAFLLFAARYGPLLARRAVG